MTGSCPWPRFRVLETNRLDSWKEIAQYLGRDVRTVERWEKEKRLPVHRVPGGRRGMVSAFANEIDQWLSGISRQPYTVSRQLAAHSPVKAGLFAAVPVALLGAGLSAVWDPDRPKPIIQLSLAGDRLQAWTGGSAVLQPASCRGAIVSASR